LGEPKGDEFNPKLSVRFNLENFVSLEKVKATYEIHYSVLDKLNEVDGVTVIDPLKYLCSDVCNVMDSSFNYYYMDSTHMRPWYAKKVLSYLEPIFYE